MINVLPVEQCWPELSLKLTAADVILVAPPGAGKSTCLPLKLLALAQFKQTQIIMLQPRQIAVRAIAQYLAQQLGETVGQTVGYRMRGENCVGPATRLVIVTEGILSRLIQNDPELSGVGLVIFDEFHERNIHADVALALSIEVQQTLREDLRLLVMSATLDIQRLSQILPCAELVESQGISYPVDIHYHPNVVNLSLEQHTCRTVQQALMQYSGDVLVFLPGARQIQGVLSLLQQQDKPGIDLYPLYGNLDKQQQIEAIAPAMLRRRKVVLATNIAETSLTIDGIRIVIDSGLENTMRFNISRKLEQLSTTMISKASAKQRAGRAGRLSAGVCLRLWSQEQHQRLVEQRPAQILETEISSVLLESKVWGTELEQLALIDQPTEAQVIYAFHLLKLLGALDVQSKVTEHGRRLHQYGCHPRLANMLHRSQDFSAQCQHLCCLLVALLEHRSLTQISARIQVSSHIDFLLQNRRHPIWKDAKRWAKKLGFSLSAEEVAQAVNWSGRMLTLAYPEQIGKLRSTGSYLMVNGMGAHLPKEQSDHLVNQPWLVSARLKLSAKSVGVIQLAEAVDESWLEQQFSEQFKQCRVHSWSDKLEKVVARSVSSFGEIVLNEKPINQPDKDQVLPILLDTLSEKGIDWLVLNKSTRQLLQRMNMARAIYGADWPDVSEQTIFQGDMQWLLPYLQNIHSLAQLKSLNWSDIFTHRLNWQQQQTLDRAMPKRLEVASGDTVALTYRSSGDVELEVKMQQIYGWQASPLIAEGNIPVILTLLSPAGRPLQKTADLTGFWQGAYREVQKEMKGRYPKHFWPDNPATAQATSKTKKYM